MRSTSQNGWNIPSPACMPRSESGADIWYNNRKTAIIPYGWPRAGDGGRMLVKPIPSRDATQDTAARAEAVRLRYIPPLDKLPVLIQPSPGRDAFLKAAFGEKHRSTRVHSRLLIVRLQPDRPCKSRISGNRNPPRRLINGAAFGLYGTFAL